MATVSARHIVDDLEATVAFHTQHLGFVVDLQPAPSCGMISRKAIF